LGRENVWLGTIYYRIRIWQESTSILAAIDAFTGTQVPARLVYRAVRTAEFVYCDRLIVVNP